MRPSAGQTQCCHMVAADNSMHRILTGDGCVVFCLHFLDFFSMRRRTENDIRTPHGTRPSVLQEKGETRKRTSAERWVKWAERDGTRGKGRRTFCTLPLLCQARALELTSQQMGHVVRPSVLTSGRNRKEKGTSSGPQY
jgi:hypothetical protein